jgi:hypothetical protein
MAETALLRGFHGGVNQSLSARDIQDNELVDALNFEMDETGSLRKRNGVSKVSTNDPFGNQPITSIYDFRQSSGAQTVIYTSGTGAWRLVSGAPEVATAFSSISTNMDGVTYPVLPNNTRWMWVTFDDVAIGVNGANTASAKSNTVELSTTTGQLAPTSNAPKGKYIAVWNRRVWIVDADSPNTLKGSALGDRTNWTTGGGADALVFPVGEDEGDLITGLYPFRGYLFVFKEHSIYAVIPGAPNTDGNQYQVKLITTQTGCVSQWTVQEVLDDLVFLGHAGLMSMQAVQSLGDFRQASLSHQIPKLAMDIPKTNDIYASVVDEEQSRYIISVPANPADSVNTETWVMDMKQVLRGGKPAWTRFDGGMVGASFAKVSYLGRPRVYIGGQTLPYILDETRYDDNVDTGYEPSNPEFTTKAYDMGQSFIRKEFYRFGLSFEPETEAMHFQLTWKLDLNDNRSKTVAGSFSSLISGSLLGGDDTLGDTGDPDFLLATGASQDTDLIWPIRGRTGRRGQNIQWRFVHPYDTYPTEGFSVKHMMAQFDFISGVTHVSDF